MWAETFTGLRSEQFERLLKAVRDRGGNGTPRGRSWGLSLAERVLVTAVHHRTNLTVRQLGPLFGISSSTVCRAIRRLGPLPAPEPVSRPGDAADRLWIVDGILIPVRDRNVGASSRDYRFSANVQVVVDADPRLVVAVDRPVTGNRDDCKAWELSGAKDAVGHTTVITDGGYRGTGLIIPHRRDPGQAELPDWKSTTAHTARSAPASSTPPPA